MVKYPCAHQPRPTYKCRPLRVSPNWQCLAPACITQATSMDPCTYRLDNIWRGLHTRESWFTHMQSKIYRFSCKIHEFVRRYRQSPMNLLGPSNRPRYIGIPLRTSIRQHWPRPHTTADPYANWPSDISRYPRRILNPCAHNPSDIGQGTRAHLTLYNVIA